MRSPLEIRVVASGRNSGEDFPVKRCDYVEIGSEVTVGANQKSRANAVFVAGGHVYDPDLKYEVLGSLVDLLCRSILCCDGGTAEGEHDGKAAEQCAE